MSQELPHLPSESQALRQISRALLRVKSEPELFQYVCDSLKEIGYISLVWIGIVEAGSFAVRPVAQAGFEQGYLASIRVAWDDSPYGLGPTGMAIKTGIPFVMSDIVHDPRYEPWRKEALKRGYASSVALPLQCEGDTIGALNVYSRRKDAFSEQRVALLQEVAADIAVGVRALRSEKQLKLSIEKLNRTLAGTIQAIEMTVEMRDPYTAGHQRRVAKLAGAIAAEMGLPEERLRGVSMAASVHDVGKICVPVEILSKPGRLSVGELSMIKTHSQVGYEILRTIESPWPIAEAALQHHERLDGSGYPSGLQATGILLEARVIGVADVVEAMASHRPYRPALGIDSALEEVGRKSGVLYDPDVVNACFRFLQKNAFSLD